MDILLNLYSIVILPEYFNLFNRIFTDFIQYRLNKHKYTLNSSLGLNETLSR